MSDLELHRETIRRRREALGWSQTDLADAVGLTGSHRRQSIHRLESGTRGITAHMAIILERALADGERKAAADRRKSDKVTAA